MSIPHRYVTPTYFGSSGFDLINVTSGGVGAGGSAFADGSKVGGPNALTYFVAFGEDATSSNANRGLRALAQNCDFIDDKLNKSIAVVVRTADVAAGAPVTNVVLPTSTFLGVAGTPDTPDGYDLLFQVLDNADREIIDATGARVRVNTVTLGGGDLIGGGGANGSFSGNTVQINFSPSIPTGTTYRVYYGSRSTLADLPLDAFTNIRIRGAQEISAETEKLFKDLHGNNLAWNAAWSSTIYDLARGGFDDRYRASSVALNNSPPDSYFPTGAGLNQAGSGGFIIRDGPAMTVYSKKTSGADVPLDPVHALFAAKFYDTVDSGGTTAFVAYGARTTAAALTGEKKYQPGHSLFLGLWSHRHNGATMHLTNPYTRIPENAACTLTTPNTNVNTGEAVIELTNVADYFRKTGTLESSIALGYDLIELQYTLAAIVRRRTMVIVAMGSSADTTNIRKVRLRNLDGTIPDFTGSSAATVIAWHSMSYHVGDGQGRIHRTANSYTLASVEADGLFYQAPPGLSSNPGDDNVARAPVGFSARLLSNQHAAMQWGGFSHTTHGPVWAGFLYGDGSMQGYKADFNGPSSAPAAFPPAGITIPRHAEASALRSVILNLPTHEDDIGEADAYPWRIYRTKGASLNLDTFEIVSNAQWNNTTSLWTPDSASRKLRFSMTDPSVYFSLAPTGAGTFADSAFVDIWKLDMANSVETLRDGKIVFSDTTTGSSGSNPPSTTAVTNRVMAKNTPKCWGLVETDGVGGVVVIDGFNIASVTIVSGDVQITMASAMADTQYAVPVSSHTASQPLACVNETGKTTTVFRLRMANTSHTQISASGASFRLGFSVFGRQS